MRASWYAKALYDVTTTGNLTEAAVIEQFIGTVSTNGHGHMLRKILRSYERILAKHAKQETIEVTTATELSHTEVAALLRKEPFSNILSTTHKRVVRKTDPNVIGGTIARTSDTRIDASYKQKLLTLYQSLTSK